MHLLLDQLVHLPAKVILKSTIFFIVLPLQRLAQLPVLTHHTFIVCMRLLHLILHSGYMTLDGTQLSLGLFELSFQISDSLLKGLNFV